MLLQKERASLIIKIVAGFIGLAFVISFIPRFGSSNPSSPKVNASSQNFEPRVKELEKVLKKDPNQPNVLLELGGDYYNWGAALENEKKIEPAVEKYGKASQALEKSLNLKPNAQGFVLLGNVYFDWGAALKAIKAAKPSAKNVDSSAKFQQAVIFYQKYLDVDPSNQDVRTDMGIAFYESGNAESAVAQFKEVLKVNPQHVNAAFNLGLVSDNAGKKDEAIKAWKSFLKIESKGSNADHARSRLKELESKK